VSQTIHRTDRFLNCTQGNVSAEYTHTHAGLWILQPDGWIEQKGFIKKNKTKIKIAMSNI